MPSRPWPLWLLTGLLLVAFPPLNFVYWPQVLRSGVLPPDGDNIAIPMFASIPVAILATPVLFGIAWLCLRRYNPQARFTAFRRDRPKRSILATFLFGGVAALLVIELVSEASAIQPWYEYLWPAYFALWFPWLLGLRAAAIEQLGKTDAKKL
jgi:hypothetical protein